MQFTTMGLVLKEVKVGESDRILTILTESSGIVSASAKGSMRLKSKLFSACGQFCYSEFTFFVGRNMYSINEASVSENFFGLRNSVEGIAVASYMAEIILALNPQRAEEINELLRLCLNSLYLLSSQKRSPQLVKAVFELRAISEGGYRPDLVACNDCGKFEAQRFYFDIENGKIYCDHCSEFQCHDTNIPLSVLTAMRHAIYAEPKKIHSFMLTDSAERCFCDICEQYALSKLDKPLKSLDFLHAVLRPPAVPKGDTEND